MKHILPIFALLFLLCSCSEKEEAGEYDNWKARNAEFIDSIATVARANADGTWQVQLAYNVGDSVELYQGNNSYFIYMKQIEKGSGTYSPLFNDSVRVHYSGRLIPTVSYPQGYNFGKSYSTNQLNEATDVPALLAMNANVTGFTTALLHMHEGDRYLVYVPSYLGYGSNKYSSVTIPAYSTLVFDVKLARVYRYRIDKDTSWH